MEQQSHTSIATSRLLTWHDMRNDPDLLVDFVGNHSPEAFVLGLVATYEHPKQPVTSYEVAYRVAQQLLVLAEDEPQSEDLYRHRMGAYKIERIHRPWRG